jgi:hypothetical protein
MSMCLCQKMADDTCSILTNHYLKVRPHASTFLPPPTDTIIRLRISSTDVHQQTTTNTLLTTYRRIVHAYQPRLLADDDTASSPRVAVDELRSSSARLTWPPAYSIYADDSDTTMLEYCLVIGEKLCCVQRKRHA